MRWRLRRLAPVLALGLFAACAPLGKSGPPAALHPSGVIVWGDSLAAEAHPYLGYEVRAYGGLALCDVLDDIRDIVATRPPAVAVLEFAGNSAPCIGSRSMLTAYAQDTATAVQILTAAGSRVVIVGIPPWRDPGHNTGALNDVYRRAAGASPVVTYSHLTVDALVENGRYTDTLPCLFGETLLQGCSGGRIQVRAPDGAHFCPVGGFPCSVYSSGARRFAVAIAASV